MNQPLPAVIAAFPRNNTGYFHTLNRTLYRGFGKPDFFSDLHSGAVGIADHAIQNPACPRPVLFRQEGKQCVYRFFLSIM